MARYNRRCHGAMEKRFGTPTIYYRLSFVAGAYAPSALRWLTTPPPEISMSARSTRQVGHADVDAIREVTQTFHRLDNLFGGGRARSTVVRYLHDEVGPLLYDGRYSETVG